MGEVCTPLLVVEPHQSFTADGEGALVITDAHTHSDILRYVVSDVGAEHAMALLETMSAPPKQGR